MRFSLVFLSVCLAAAPATAQLALPGAAEPAPVGTVSRPPKPVAAKRKSDVPRAVAPTPPAETALAGKTLALNGGKSQITFAPRDKTVEIARLSLSGTKVAGGGECQIDVAGTPLGLTPLGKTDGLTRFAVAPKTCPFSFTVLDGAILLSPDDQACRVVANDCQAGLAGLWGPAAGSIGPDEAKTIERERTGAERSVRTAYKGLVSSTKDRAVISTYASDQAGFSSYREEHCRDYIGESRHGFCASRLTQARALTLEAELVVAQAAKEARKKKRAERAGKR